MKLFVDNYMKLMNNVVLQKLTLSDGLNTNKGKLLHCTIKMANEELDDPVEHEVKTV